MLKEYLTENLVDACVEVDNWEEALEFSGKLLEKSNKIKNEYIKEIINAVHELGPYIVICPGVALAHARPCKFVLEECVSLITLKKAVEFGNETNDPVDIVFTFGTNETNGHLKMIQNLTSFLTEESNITMLKNSNSKEDILKIISEY